MRCSFPVLLLGLLLCLMAMFNLNVHSAQQSANDPATVLTANYTAQESEVTASAELVLAGATQQYLYTENLRRLQESTEPTATARNEVLTTQYAACGAGRRGIFNFKARRAARGSTC